MDIVEGTKMKLGRLVVPAIAAIAVVLLGTLTGRLVLTGPILATEPTPIAIPLPEPPEKARPVERSPQATRSQAAAAPEQEPVHTWEDGDRTMRVVLQDDLVVQKTVANTSEDVVVSEGAEDSVVRKRARHGPDALPVFRSESGAGLMTLPGGVLLALDPGWDDAQVEGFFSNNEIPAERVSELGFLQNGFLIETEPGFPSLELANALAGQEGVLISSPNWRTEVEAK